jgi:hypothetical protein
MVNVSIFHLDTLTGTFVLRWFDISTTLYRISVSKYLYLLDLEYPRVKAFCWFLPEVLRSLTVYVTVEKVSLDAFSRPLKLSTFVLIRTSLVINFSLFFCLFIVFSLLCSNK